MQSSAENDARVMTLANAALGMPAAKRAEFLLAACKDQHELYSEVIQVVEWEERMGDFLRQPLINFIDLEVPENPENPFAPNQALAERFVILGEVGRGGMGVVYEAFDRKRNQRIAIKCAKAGFGRLLSPELEGALKVRHPNICLVNEIHSASADLDERDFLTMEFLEGETLTARLVRDGKLDPEEALVIARQLCAGLAAAHQAEILHRDLKPGNVILTHTEDGTLRAVITDFGLATDTRIASELCGGTPRYMAPELWHGDKPGKPADVYALGVILYEMITGAPPISENRGSSSAPSLAPPSTLNKNLDKRWDEAILPCLAADPTARPEADQVLAVFDRRPWWKSPWPAVAALAFVAIIAFFQQPLFKLFKPADIRLTVLPLNAPPDLQEMGNGVLQDVQGRIARSQLRNATLVIISREDVAGNDVQTPEQAQRILHATHVLQLKLSRNGENIVAAESVIDLAHHTHILDFYAEYPPSVTGDIPAGLTGAITSALRLRSNESDHLDPIATASYGRARVFMENSNFQEAISEFQESARLDPHSPMPLAGLAEAEIKRFEERKTEGALDDARRALQAAEALNPDSIRVLMAKGALSEAEGHYAAALADYQRVLEIEPRNMDALLKSATLYDVQEMPGEAAKCYHEAIALDPNYYEPYKWFGAFLFSHGQYQDAEEQFRNEVQRGPGRPEGYGNLGAILLVQGKYQEAVEVLSSALKIKETPQTLNNIGAAFANLKQDQNAIHAYKRALDFMPQNPLYWMNLGDSERRMGNAPNAKQAYLKSRELVLQELNANAQRGQTRAILGYLEARLGENRRAKQEVTQALSTWPGDNQVIRYAVLAFEALGKREFAIKAASGGTVQLMQELDRHPDLTDFRKDERFIRLRTTNAKGG